MPRYFSALARAERRVQLRWVCAETYDALFVAIVGQLSKCPQVRCMAENGSTWLACNDD